ncbi:DDE-type integrase/transposase/recombinase [Cohnella suwonensis]|uniref:DDE-type integrase/transposase/recombinase n=1 Tax=Cohnella suwonensis TaxID=696072 RepID=A0ABW0LT51_9BACL
MILTANEILLHQETNKLYRILWIEENNIIVYLIDMDDENEKALPFKRKFQEIQDELITGTLLKQKEDPYFSIVQQSPNTKNISIRDQAWQLIKDIVVQEPKIYEKHNRTKLMASVQAEQSISYPGLRKYLRKYWQRGKNPNALLPDYHLSGGRGNEKQSGDKKRGRPSIYSSIGINVDDETKKNFRFAIDKYYLNNKKNSLTKTFEFLLKEFYAEDFYYENGILKMKFKDENKLPKERQFRYWFHKEYSTKEVLVAREGSRKYGKDHRELLSSATQEAYGPGSRYLIDATSVNCYILSRDNPNWIIGRPVLYLVVDVFSRMVVGMYIGLEGPSWMGAMMAIANTAMDKVKYCSEYGINISKEAWPCESLPEILLGDRGELEGYQPERLVSAFNLHLENAAPYRADWKGIVEKRFDVTDQKVKPFLPGYVEKDASERGAPDYRIKARLTLEQFTSIIIKQVLAYNMTHYIENYHRDGDLLEDNVEPVPLALWNWGIQHRSGKHNYFAEKIVRFHLLPQEDVSVTEKGIRLNSKLFYSCDRAIKEEWFVHARNKGTWKMKASLDPRNISNLYILNEKTGDIEPCFLLDESKRYEGLSLDEVKYITAQEKIMRSGLKLEELKAQLGFMEDAEKEAKQAEKESNQNRSSNLSKAEQTKSIQKNRQYEKGARRKEEAFTFVESNKTAAQVIPFSKEVQTDDFKRPSIKDLLKQRMEQKDE